MRGCWRDYFWTCVRPYPRDWYYREVNHRVHKEQRANHFSLCDLCVLRGSNPLQHWLGSKLNDFFDIGVVEEAFSW